MLLFFTIFFIIVWHALVPRKFSFWPFPFVNFTRYFAPLLTLLGAIAVGLGVDWLPRLRHRPWGALSLIVSCAIPTAGGILILMNAQKIYPAQAVFCAVLTGIPIIALLGTIGGFYVLSKRYKKIKGALVIVVFAEAFFFTRYSPEYNAIYIRIVLYVLLCSAAVLLSIRKMRMAVALVSASGVLFVLWFAIFYDVETRIDPNKVSPYINAAEFLKKQTPIQAQKGFRPRVLGTGFRNTYIGFNSYIGVDNLVTMIAILPRTWAGYIFDLLRPKTMETNYIFTYPNVFFGMGKMKTRWSDADLVSSYFNIPWSVYFEKYYFFQLLGASYLMDFQGGPLEKALLRHPEWKTGLELVYDAPHPYRGTYDIKIYRDKCALPRAFFTPSFGLVPKTEDGWAARKWMVENRETLKKKPVVELDYSSLPKFASIVYPLREPFLVNRYYNNAYLFQSREDSNNEVIGQKITSYRPNEVRISVNAPREGLLVLNDAYHPNWRVTINNESKPLVRVNSIVRGVFVRSGQHEVVFSYKPFGDFVKWLPVVGILCMIAFAFVLHRHNKQ